MRIHHLTPFLVILLSASISAQDGQNEINNAGLEYLNAESFQIYRIPDHSISPESACFIGQYNKGCENEPIGSCSGFKEKNVHDALAAGFSAENAVDFIDSASRKNNVLFISESHVIGQHRLLVISLLERLWRNGYRILFLESLSSTDTTFASFGYPTITTGYYIRDPFYGELVRMAISLGYKIESFDSYGNEASVNKNEVEFIIEGDLYNRKPQGGTYTSPDGVVLELSEGELILSMREFEMATKIENYLKNADQNKILIFGGEGHNYKESCGRHIRAGDFLKRFYKRDFLSIVQHSFTNKNLKPVLPFASNILVKGTTPYLSKPGYCPFNRIGQEYDIEVMNYYDTTLAFPIELIQKYNLNYKSHTIEIPTNLNKLKKLLLVYHTKEQPATAVPAFVSLIEAGEQSATMWLSPGDYVYFLRDDNKVYFKSKITIHN